MDWTRSHSPLAGRYHDQQGYIVLLTEYWHVFEEIRLEPERLIEVGEHVVVPNVSHVRGRGGIALSGKGVYVFTVRDGLIVAFALYQQLGEALQAARSLSAQPLFAAA